MTIVEKIEFLMKQRGLNKHSLAVESGISYTTIMSIFQRGGDQMRLPTFGRICYFFGVTMDSMAYDENEIQYVDEVNAKLRDSNRINKDERNLVNDYRKLDTRGKNTVQNTVKTELSYAEPQIDESEDSKKGSAIKTA